VLFCLYNSGIRLNSLDPRPVPAAESGFSSLRRTLALRAVTFFKEPAALLAIIVSALVTTAVVPWSAGRVLYLLGSGSVLIGAVVYLVRRNERAVELSQRLGDEVRRTDRHAARLRSLWLTGATACGDEAFFRTVLDDASMALVDGRRFHAFLVHFSEGCMVVDAANDAFVGPDIAVAGASYAVEESILGIVRREGATEAWADIRDDARFDRSPRLRRLPWRAVIGTSFRVGQTLYGICFASPLAAGREDFGVRAREYVEIVASTCAARLQQQAQFERLRHQSEHDQLTGIFNRATFRSHGFAALREDAPLAVVVADIDRFREVNDTLGHQTGDALLVEVAARLASLASANDVVARLGGDSFGFLLPGVENAGEAARRVSRYLDAFREPFSTGDRNGTERVVLTASFGIAIAPSDGRAFEELLARADAAVYHAKQGGRARWAFFDHRFEESLVAAYKLKEELAAALVRNEFELYFQPHVDLFDGRTAGAEALIRWNHPQRGLLTAGEFMPFAERHGLTERIGIWVMREAIRVSAPWRSADPEFCMWFNLSQSELHPATLRGRLAELGADLRGLGVEITEGTAMSSSGEMAEAIAMLRAAGFGIALDDFGTGYSSLVHLRRLPIDIVKIDRSFVAGLPHDRQDVAIVDAVLSIGKSYGFAVVAEGVETEEQVAYLASAGCTYVQGYFYARPMPAAAFEAWLKAHIAPYVPMISA
jgi:diguanylate cyclase (GGDEF)-like protein